MSNRELVKSQLQFDNPCITEFNFHVNSNVTETKQMTASYTVTQNRAQNADACLLQLKVNIGEDSSVSPFTIEAAIQSVFEWNASLTDDQLDKLLSENAVALLISYLRPMISHMTVDAGFPPLILPFFDIRQQGNNSSE